MAIKRSETLDPPRLKHFTLDPLCPIGDDPETVPPSAAFNRAEAEQVKALSDATREHYEERLEAEREAEEDRAEEPAPKPTELLAAQQGSGTTTQSSTA